MRILLVSSNSSGSGGGELFFLKLAGHLIERGESVSVGYSDDDQFNGLAQQAQAAGCRVIRFSYVRVYDRKFRSLGLFLRGTARGISGINVDSYDVVHVSQQNVEDGIDLVAAFGRICPERLIVTIHIVERLRRLGQRMGALRQIYPRVVYRALSDKIRFAFVSSSAQALFADMFGVRPVRGRVIYNGATPGLTSSTPTLVREELGIATDAFVVGSVGRLEEQKNYRALVKAFATAKATADNLRLLLVGDGSQRDELVQMAVSLGVSDSLIVTGWVADPVRFLDAMDVFVLPSWFEGFPFALVEALMAGNVCLASAIPPHSECLAGQTSLLFDPVDVPELSELLIRAAGRDAKISKAAAIAVENARTKFSIDAMVDQMVDLYRTPVAEH